jgi:O-antigen/teichoic acid export membrane protein
MHQAVIGTSTVVLGTLLFLLGASKIAWTVCIASAAIMLQAFWSAYLKSIGRPEESLLLESGLWGLIAAVAVGTWLSGAADESKDSWLWVFAAVYGASLLLVTTNAAFSARADDTATYVETMRFSLPLMFTALLSVFVTTSGRLATGFLTTPETTADYAILFRVTAIPIVAHQVIMVAKFRRLFEMPMPELDRRLVLVAVLVMLSVMVCWALMEAAAPFVGTSFRESLARHPRVALLVLVQCLLWSAIATNDLVNSRAMLAGAAAKWTGGYLATVLIASLWGVSEWNGSVTLEAFVPMHSAVMLGFYLVQVAVMFRSGIRLWAVWGVTLLSFVGLSVAALLLPGPHPAS